MSKVIRIGSWRFHPERNLLETDKTRRELEHRLSTLLSCLIGCPGQILSKDTLMAAVWGKRVVGDDSLAVAISHLRRALDDRPRTPEYIRTVPGVGYQWIGPEPEEAGPGTGNGVLTLVAALGICAVVALVSWWKLDIGTASRIDAVEERRPLDTAQSLLASDDPEAWRRAVGLFRNAISDDPGAAQAFVGLVEAKLKQIRHEDAPVNPHYDELQGLLGEALSLDPDHEHALLMRADLFFLVARDHRAASTAYRTLLAAHPGHARGRLAYANFLLAHGRFDAAMAELDILRREHPVLYAVPMVAWHLLMQGETTLAWQEIQRITSTEPEAVAYHASAQHIAFQRQDERLAMDHMLALMDQAGFAEQRLEEFDQTFLAGGLAAVHGRLLAERETASLGHYRPPLSWARYALVAGRTDAALEHLESALANRQEALLWIGVDPHYRSLRQHARFQAVLSELGLSPAADS